MPVRSRIAALIARLHRVRTGNRLGLLDIDGGKNRETLGLGQYPVELPVRCDGSE